MTALPLPHGPWKLLLSGTWSEKEIAYYENPDKQLLILIFDRAGSSVKGMVLMLARFFAVEGNATNLAEALKNNTVLLQKHTPLFKGSFLGMVTDPKYIRFTPRELITAVDETYLEMEKLSTQARSESANYNVKLVDIKYSAPEGVQELFGEPLALPSIVVRKAGPQMMMPVVTGKAHLGMTTEGEKAEETLQSFLLTIVTGKQRAQAIRILLESCVTNGVSTIVFDDGLYSKVDQPNTNTTEFSAYKVDSDPMGMPVRKFKPGTDMFIDLTVMDKDTFSEATGIGKGITTDLIGHLLDKKVKTLKELKEKLSAEKEKEALYYAMRGIRICNLFDILAPGLFSGRVESTEIVAPWLKKMGRVALVDIRGMDAQLIKGLAYAIMKSIYNDYKKEYSSNEMKVAVILDKPGLTSGEGGVLEKKIVELAKLSQTMGIGVIVASENPLDIEKELLENSTARIDAFEGNEASVQMQGKRAYRARLRPALSAE
jgi:hypothetical protein